MISSVLVISIIMIQNSTVNKNKNWNKFQRIRESPEQEFPRVKGMSKDSDRLWIWTLGERMRLMCSTPIRHISFAQSKILFYITLDFSKTTPQMQVGFLKNTMWINQKIFILSLKITELSEIRVSQKLIFCSSLQPL